MKKIIFLIAFLLILSSISYAQIACSDNSDCSYHMICDDFSVSLNGVCIRIDCTDTDGGSKEFEKGTTTTTTKWWTSSGDDLCYDTNELEELYCLDNGQSDSTIIICGNGCEDGECIRESDKDSCSDSDGGKIYDKTGCVRGFKNNVEYTHCDECSTEDKSLYEYYCSGDIYSMIRQPCTNGCANGECVESPIVEICNNKIDDDRDGMIDCLDNDCSNDVIACPPPPECTNGETKKYTCEDGSQVDWCACQNNQWACIISPETQCKGDDIAFWIILICVIGGIGGTIYYLFFKKKKR